MAYINTVETENIQAGLAGAPPIATVDVWPSLDPTKPFTLQTTGVNNFIAVTNQIGSHFNVGSFFGIGTTKKIALDSTLGFRVKLGGTAAAEPKIENSALSEAFSSPNGKLNGLWKFNGSVICVAPCSDVRSKKNITPLEDSLSKVLKLQGVSFDWNEEVVPLKAKTQGRQIGLIAQEVEQIVPEAVTTEIVEEQNLKSINYALLTSILVEAVKEQQQQIESLKQTVQELSTKLADCCGA